MPYTIVKDSREKAGHGWNFRKSEHCSGQITTMLATGDYTILGLEDVFTIERKGTVREFAQNVTEKRFDAELQRLDLITYPFVVLEFTMDDLLKYPVGSGIPAYKWKYLVIKGPQILKLMLEFEIKYRTKFILAGEHGQAVATSIFKRVMESVNVKRSKSKKQNKA